MTGSLLAGSLTISASPVLARVRKVERVVILHKGALSTAHALNTSCSVLASAIKGKLMLTARDDLVWCLFYTYNYIYKGPKVQKYALHLSGPKLQHYSQYVYGNGSKCNIVGRKIKQKIERNTSHAGIKYMCLLLDDDIDEE